MQVAQHVIDAALQAASDPAATALERSEMLMELAMGLQRKPRTPDDLPAAVRLYDEALALCPPDMPLLAARITARKATALQAMPGEATRPLEEARSCHEAAIPVLGRLGTAEELAEAEMNLGLVLQYLAACGKAKFGDAIAAYHRAGRTFESSRYPVEFSILQNNLATAYLAMAAGNARPAVHEALAVQAFEAALKVVERKKHPAEYGMLQNNLGNALQYASSSHASENNMRALAAYDEALSVRSRERTPVEYANTLANKANCLHNLGRLAEARASYGEARDVFVASGDLEKAAIVSECLDRMEPER